MGEVRVGPPLGVTEFHERRPTFKALKYTGQSIDEIAAELEVTVRSTRGPLMAGASVEIWTEPNDWKRADIGERHWIVVGRTGIEVLDDREFEKRFEPAKYTWLGSEASPRERWQEHEWLVAAAAAEVTRALRPELERIAQLLDHWQRGGGKGQRPR